MNRQPVTERFTSIFDPIGESVVRRILVVDDEETIRRSIGRFLSARGFDVEVAEDGTVALETLQLRPFDALLCDVRMPGLSGTDVVPRALDIHPDLAVLMLTAVNDAPTATDALARGAMDYLMKPVELNDLATAVERALRRRELEIQRGKVERMIREEVAIATEELREEQQQLAEISISIVRSLVNAQEAKDPFLRGHSQRVAAMSAAVASAIGLPDDAVEALRLAGQLHDVGKIGIPESLLNKAGPLTEDEYRRVKDHVRIGMEILTPLKPLAHVLPAIQDHHERWDGSGYPRQLAGERISLGGRILAVVDAFDALTSRRAYREPLTPAETLDLLSSTSATHLDPSLLAVLRQMVQDRTSLHFIDEAR